jgi:coupling of ubiquitin conjugation to ER degradation protein 1
MQSIVIALIIIFLIYYYYYYTGEEEPNPTSIEDRVKLVSTMFPHVPKVLIESDLRNGSRVEEVCEKIMSGRLTATEASSSFNANTDSNPTSQAEGSVSSKPPQNLYLKDLIDKPAIEEEPPKVWESEGEKRHELLRQRKAFMIQQARLKFLNKD